MSKSTSLPPRRILLRAVHERDRSWEGAFYFGVRTTGVVCRPGCPARRPRDDNLRFFADLESARAAGFRECLRCRPGRVGGAPQWWTRAVALAEASETGTITDAALTEAGLEPSRVRRYCQREHGKTFHSWCRARRIARAQRQLNEGNSVDQVVIESGYNSHSGFRDAFQRITGGPPAARRGSEPVSIWSLDSPLGRLVVGATDDGICLLEFDEPGRLVQQAARLARRHGGPIVEERHPLHARLADELDRYWGGGLREFTVPVVARGTAFEEATWAALLEIPWGETRSYADVAAAIGKPGAVRAVGSANGRNRVAIVIPCHRVVNASGALGGYGGGLWRKRRLLAIEAEAGLRGA